MNDKHFEDFEVVLSRDYRKVARKVGKKKKSTKIALVYRKKAARKVGKTKKSRFRGVSWDRRNNKYKARKWDKENQTDYHRGYHSSELEAAKWVNVACDELGEPWDNPEVGLPDVIVPKKGKKPTRRDPPRETCRESSISGDDDDDDHDVLGGCAAFAWENVRPLGNSGCPILAQPDLDPYCSMLNGKIQNTDPDTRTKVQRKIQEICDIYFPNFLGDEHGLSLGFLS